MLCSYCRDKCGAFKTWFVCHNHDFPVKFYLDDTDQVFLTTIVLKIDKIYYEILLMHVLSITKIYKIYFSETQYEKEIHKFNYLWDITPDNALSSLDKALSLLVFT